MGPSNLTHRVATPSHSCVGAVWISTSRRYSHNHENARAKASQPKVIKVIKCDSEVAIVMLLIQVFFPKSIFFGKNYDKKMDDKNC